MTNPVNRENGGSTAYYVNNENTTLNNGDGPNTEKFPAPVAEWGKQSWLPVMDAQTRVIHGYVPAPSDITETTTALVFEGVTVPLSIIEVRKMTPDLWQNGGLFKLQFIQSPTAFQDKESGMSPHSFHGHNPAVAYRNDGNWSGNDAPKGLPENPMQPRAEMFNWVPSLFKMIDPVLQYQWQRVGVFSNTDRHHFDEFVEWLYKPGENTEIVGLPTALAGAVNQENQNTQAEIVNGGVIEDKPLTVKPHSYIWYINRQGPHGATHNVSKGDLFSRARHNQFLNFSAQMHFQANPFGVSNARVRRPVSDPGHGEFLVALMVPSVLSNSARTSSSGGGVMSSVFLDALDNRHNRAAPTGKDTGSDATNGLTRKELFDETGGMGWSQSDTIRVICIRKDSTPVPAGDYVWPVEFTSRTGEVVETTLTITVTAEQNNP